MFADDNIFILNMWLHMNSTTHLPMANFFQKYFQRIKRGIAQTYSEPCQAYKMTFLRK